jgi:ribonuclease Z
MKSWIQILGTDTVDVTPSIIVHYDSQRYLFNCGEGTQRLFVEKGVKFGKMQHVFCTRVDWECIGGLPGMLLTVSDAGINKLTLHGGPNLTHFIVATRHFIYRSTMHVTANEFKDAEPYVDENMRVYPVMVYPEYAPVRKRSADVDDEQAKEIRLKLLKTMFGSALRAQQAEQCDGVENEVRLTEQEQRHLPKTKPSKTVVCYVCHGPDVRGKFNPKAAKALGLKPGALFRTYS